LGVGNGALENTRTPSLANAKLRVGSAPFRGRQTNRERSGGPDRCNEKAGEAAVLGKRLRQD